MKIYDPGNQLELTQYDTDRLLLSQAYSHVKQCQKCLQELLTREIGTANSIMLLTSVAVDIRNNYNTRGCGERQGMLESGTESIPKPLV